MGRGRANGGGVERTSPAHGASFFFLRPPTLELSVAFSSQRTSRARAARALAAGTSSRRWRRGHGEEATSLSAAGAALGTASLRSSKSCGLSVRGRRHGTPKTGWVGARSGSGIRGWGRHGDHHAERTERVGAGQSVGIGWAPAWSHDRSWVPGEGPGAAQCAAASAAEALGSHLRGRHWVGTSVERGQSLPKMSLGCKPRKRPGALRSPRAP